MTLPTTTFQKWRFALKPGSWPKLFVPMMMGHALGGAQRGGLDLEVAVVGAVLTFFLLASIVLLNDFGDREVDKIKRRIYPHSSPKTIPDGVLPAHHLLFAGVAAGSVFVAGSFWAASWAGRPGFGWLGVLAFMTFAAYSLPPLRLNYRGGGELLEMLGVGFVLPWMNAYLQAGLGAESAWWFPKASVLFGGLMLLALSSAIASGLSDEVSDRRGGKKTFTTAFGNPAARRLVETLVLFAVVAFLAAGIFSAHVPFPVVLPTCAMLLWRRHQMRTLSPAAVTGSLNVLSTYKARLHAGTWRGVEVLAGALIAYRMFIG
ncbi:MAG: 1,4-dihydroxy-2-naphthoate octaprenyltransferase [Polyangiales bacterium]|jgi:1,4-dihydroxy-2-naphthoate octaprenyltransferase